MSLKHVRTLQMKVTAKDTTFTVSILSKTLPNTEHSLATQTTQSGTKHAASIIHPPTRTFQVKVERNGDIKQTGAYSIDVYINSVFHARKLKPKGSSPQTLLTGKRVSPISQIPFMFPNWQSTGETDVIQIKIYKGVMGHVVPFSKYPKEGVGADVEDVPFLRTCTFVRDVTHPEVMVTFLSQREHKPNDESPKCDVRADRDDPILVPESPPLKYSKRVRSKVKPQGRLQMMAIDVESDSSLIEIESPSTRVTKRKLELIEID